MTLQDRTTSALAWIDAQLAICNAATKGPWHIQKYTNYHGFSVWGSGCCIAERWYNDAVAEKDAKELAGDAAFIAAARVGYPAMLEGMKVAIKGLCAFRPYREDRPALQKVLISMLNQIESLQ